LIVKLIKIKVRPEKRKELAQTLNSIVEQVRKEHGCLHSGFYQDLENEEDFLVVEEWATQKDSDAHLRSDIFTVILGAGSLMHGPPKVIIHTVNRSTEFATGTPKTHSKQ
jgi:quinol monooxygenase YgiN